MSLSTMRTRIREDPGYVSARDVRSTRPYTYTITDGMQANCSIVPDAQDYVQCNKTWANNDNDVSNYLRFGEAFATYEPGNAVSTVLQQHSFYAGRGEGIVRKKLIDVDSSLKLPPKANAYDTRGRDRIREADITAHKFPPNYGALVPKDCSRIFEHVVVESSGPRGGRSTRCDVRNATPLIVR